MDSRAPSEPVSTGHAGLDRLLYGGLPSNCAVALTSPSCSERDLLVESFLETGAKKGEVAFYVTINPGLMKMLAVDYPSNLYLFVCNPQANAMVKDAPNVVKLKGVENLTDISIELTSAIRKLDSSPKGSRRICLGLVSDILLQHHAVQTRRWLAGLIPELQSEGFTILAVMDSQIHSSEELRAITGIFDGEISIFEKEGEKGGRKYLKVNKMGNQKYLEDEVPLGREEPEVSQEESKSVQIVLDKHRIAVLPLVNMSPDPNDEYFADSVTEEIISTVSGISGLKVISRTSVMGYKGTTKKVEEIGRELRVGSVLEGSFRKAGNRIRVTTQLIDVAKDEHLWAQNYDRNLDDLFEVQSDIAKQVAEALQVRILPSEEERVDRRPTSSTFAYTLYLRGRSHWNKRRFEDLKKAREYFELAVHEDPDFALGYAGLADSCVLLRTNWRNEPEANLARAKAMTDKALTLDPELAEAHTVRAGLLNVEYNHRRAEEEFKRAIELKPGYATAHQWYSLLLDSQARWDEARKEIEKAVELDPLSPMIHANHGDYHYYKRDYPKAIDNYRKAIELGLTPAYEGTARVYGLIGRFDDMKREYANYVELNKDSDPFAQLWTDLNEARLEDDKKTVSQLLPELVAHFGHDRGPQAWDIGAFYFYLGENDKGFEWLERSYSKNEFFLTLVGVDPFFDCVRTDPRYFDLLKRLGLDQTTRQSTRARHSHQNDCY